MPMIYPPRKGENVIDWCTNVADVLNRLMKGPGVCAPMAKKDGVIYLAQDYQMYLAKTTGTIDARVGSQWGTGDAKFLTVGADGVESDMPGFKAFTAWNYFGADISSGIRVEVFWAYDKWVIAGGDCSGVA